MSTLKTKIDTKKVIAFLQKNFDKNTSSINFLKGGEMSQAFSFKSNGKDLVIRINNKSYSFEKDRYAFEHFNSLRVPIPKIFSLGRFDKNLFYAISEMASGKTLDLYDTKTREKLLPQLISIHDAIRNTKIEGNGKFGDWDSRGDAEFDSWKEFILGKKDDVYENWEKLYKSTFLEREPVEKITKRINELSNFLPEECHLIHGDYGGNNMTGTKEKITGVLDWGESKYGDSIYDISWMEFYFEDIAYGNIFFKHYQNTGLNTKNFNERLLCYQLHIGLGGIGFFALSEQKESYKWAKNKLLNLLEKPAA